MMIASWVGGLNAILNYMQTLENFQLVICIKRSRSVHKYGDFLGKQVETVSGKLGSVNGTVIRRKLVKCLTRD